MDPETRDYLRSVFGSPPPRDVVRGSGLTREAVIHQNDMTGKTVQITIPGHVIEDADGNPIGMTPSETSTGTFGGTCMTLRELEAVGLTPEQVPNIRVIDEPRKDQDQ